MWKRLYKESRDYPVDSGIKENAERKSYNFTSLEYFGDCKNTVDVDRMWDATQMAGVVYKSVVVPFKCAENKMEGGDRSIPRKLLRWIAKNPDKLDDESEIVCGNNEEQRIFFIYVSDFDTHFFFDSRWN